MLDHILDEVLLAHLTTAPVLAPLNAYTGQDNADHKLPALTVSGKPEPRVTTVVNFQPPITLPIAPSLR